MATLTNQRIDARAAKLSRPRGSCLDAQIANWNRGDFIRKPPNVGAETGARIGLTNVELQRDEL